MSKAQQAAEERFDRDDDDYAALVVGFTEGWEAALPEEPDPAVIEAMAKGCFMAYNDRGWDADDWDSEWLGERVRDVWRDHARAAYAALRGAMQ